MWIKMRPSCAVCNKKIVEDSCYVTNAGPEWYNCICKDCGKEQLAKARECLDPGIADILDDYFFDALGRTPEREAEILERGA